MEIQKENPVWENLNQPVGKSQLYALLVDSAGNPVLNGSGGQQVVAMQSANGRLNVDASITGSLAKLVSSIIGAFAVSTTTIPKTITNQNCTVHVLSGNCWINPLATAVADATAIKLLSGMILDLRVASSLSLISDSTGASVQIIAWSD